MLVERDRATGFEFASGRLSYVVQQSRKTQNEIAFQSIVGFVRDDLFHNAKGVLVDILVVVVFVNLEPQRRQFGQHALGQTRIDQGL